MYYLSLQEREQAAAHKGLSILAGAEMMRAVSTGRNICEPEKCSESVIVQTVCGQEIYREDIRKRLLICSAEYIPAWMLSPAPVQK
jgi:hypothetical protein